MYVLIAPSIPKGTKLAFLATATRVSTLAPLTMKPLTQGIIVPHQIPQQLLFGSFAQWHAATTIFGRNILHLYVFRESIENFILSS
jgi:hypothetical protein